MKCFKLITGLSAFLMLTATLSGTLISCGKNDEVKEEAETEAVDDLEEGGLNGYTFNILSAEPWYSDTPDNLMYTEEANGDTMREAVYARNSKVTDKYGLEIVQTYMPPETDLNSEVIKITTAQDDAYQVVTSYVSRATPYLQQNIYDNVADLPHINHDAEYWHGDTMELLAINGFEVGLIGDFMFNTYEEMVLTMYNTPMAADFGIENLYDVTNEGGWTFERMMTEMEKVITDLNNDGEYDVEDRIGLLYCSNIAGIYYTAAGICFGGKDENGKFYFDDSVNERATLLGETASKLVGTTGYAWDWLNMSSENAIIAIISMIENKQALFQNMIISQVRRFYREIKTDFGLLPLPKLNEEQDKYYSDGSIGALLVPSSNLDLDKTGFAAEAICRYSSDFPNVYFHVALESKFTRDAESIDMIMLCYRNNYVDPIGIYDIGSGFGAATTNVILYGNSYMTAYADYADTIAADIENLNMMEIS